MEPEHVVVGDITVKFPYQPYEVQKVYMERVVECLKEKKFGCLESPTGTGKTLALLCASLAWLESERGLKATSSGADADIKALLEGGAPPSTWQGPPPAKSRIVYASRTHSQLAQVIQEFKRSPYSHVQAVILASRDQLCINEQLAHVKDKNQMCKVKIRTSSCQYYANTERQGTSYTPDVEDVASLRKNGERRKLCPYYASRNMAAEADLVFLPYNYLVDPKIRKTLAINLEQCAVIIDEAHNVLKIFEDSSSISFSGKDVAVALSDLDYVLKVVFGAHF